VRRPLRSLRRWLDVRLARWRRRLGRAPGRLDALWRRWSGRARRRALIARMQPGDVVLASPRLRRLSVTALMYRVLLRSRYVHAMLYLGDGRIIHTTAREGVTVGRLPGKLFDRTRYRVRRVPGLTAAERARVTAAAEALLDHALDHAGLVTNIPARWLGLPHPLLQAERRRLWCSKLIHRAYREVGVELVPTREPGTVTSEDLARSSVLRDV
jgi:cell wall-associated NlpC family hydrolase